MKQDNKNKHYYLCYSYPFQRFKRILLNTAISSIQFLCLFPLYVQMVTCAPNNFYFFYDVCWNCIGLKWSSTLGPLVWILCFLLSMFAFANGFCGICVFLFMFIFYILNVCKYWHFHILNIRKYLNISYFVSFRFKMIAFQFSLKYLLIFQLQTKQQIYINLCFLLLSM